MSSQLVASPTLEIENGSSPTQNSIVFENNTPPFKPRSVVLYNKGNKVNPSMQIPAKGSGSGLSGKADLNQDGSHDDSISSYEEVSDLEKSQNSKASVNNRGNKTSTQDSITKQQQKKKTEPLGVKESMEHYISQNPCLASSPKLRKILEARDIIIRTVLSSTKLPQSNKNTVLEEMTRIEEIFIQLELELLEQRIVSRLSTAHLASYSVETEANILTPEKPITAPAQVPIVAINYAQAAKKAISTLHLDSEKTVEEMEAQLQSTDIADQLNVVSVRRKGKGLELQCSSLEAASKVDRKSVV